MTTDDLLSTLQTFGWGVSLHLHYTNQWSASIYRWISLPGHYPWWPTGKALADTPLAALQSALALAEAAVANQTGAIPVESANAPALLNLLGLAAKPASEPRITRRI